MLDITVADAVLVGGFFVTLLMAWRGAKDGEKAKTERPPAPEMAILGATMVDTDTFRDVAAAIRDLTKAVREAIDDRREEVQDRMTELLEEISKKLDQAPPKPPRPPRRRGPR